MTCMTQNETLILSFFFLLTSRLFVSFALLLCILSVIFQSGSDVGLRKEEENSKSKPKHVDWPIPSKVYLMNDFSREFQLTKLTFQSHKERKLLQRKTVKLFRA